MLLYLGLKMGSKFKLSLKHPIISVFFLGCHKEGAQRVQKHRNGGARIKSTSNQVIM